MMAEMEKVWDKWWRGEIDTGKNQRNKWSKKDYKEKNMSLLGE